MKELAGVHHGNVKKYSMRFDSNNIGMPDIIQTILYDSLIDYEMIEEYLEK